MQRDAIAGLIFCCMAIVLTTDGALGQSIEWRKSLTKATREAEIYNRPMFVYLSTNW